MIDDSLRGESIMANLNSNLSKFQIPSELNFCWCSSKNLRTSVGICPNITAQDQVKQLKLRIGKTGL